MNSIHIDDTIQYFSTSFFGSESGYVPDQVRRFSYVINMEGSVNLLHPLGCSVDCVVVIGGSLDVRSYHTGKEQLNDKTSGVEES
jgi:hypothetical protein